MRIIPILMIGISLIAGFLLYKTNQFASTIWFIQFPIWIGVALNEQKISKLKKSISNG